MTKLILTNEDKEEICSDVFFILWKNTKKLDINKKLSSYIAGVTRNVVKDYIKTNKKQEKIMIAMKVHMEAL